MPEFYCAELDMRVCEENHVHINLKALEVDCPILGIALSAEDAREMACKLLEAANEISPVS
jgi:hypothetical protein